MNQDSDKEMDLLLRRYTRRSAPSLTGAIDANAKLKDAGKSATHMDADELSAYAEGALPDAARLRYASHLADCDSCRRIVTELILSAKVEAVEGGTVAQTVDVPGRSWREWFAALFSPPVLRYAAPALALVAFAAIVFVVMTRNREIPSFVAQNEQNRQQPANAGVVEPKDGTTTTSAGTSSASDNQAAAPNTNAGSGAQNSNAPVSQSQQKDANTAAKPSEIDRISSADLPANADVTVSGSPPPSVQEGKTESTQPSTPVQSSPADDRFADRAKEKDDALAAQKRRESGEAAAGGGAPSAGAAGGRSSSSTKTANNQGLGAASTTTEDERQKNNEAVTTTKRAPAAAARARRDATGADGDSTETRTVAGKNFRQQKGVWVDTSYNSSRSLVKVRRGSEQFRALVADEPLIGTVANSLGGSVIVVVKGRAYHIY